MILRCQPAPGPEAKVPAQAEKGRKTRQPVEVSNLDGPADPRAVDADGSCQPQSEGPLADYHSAEERFISTCGLADGTGPKFPKSFPATLYDPHSTADLDRIRQELGEMPEIERPEPRCSEKLYIEAENRRAEIEGSCRRSETNDTTQQEVNLILLESELDCAFEREGMTLDEAGQRTVRDRSHDVRQAFKRLAKNRKTPLAFNNIQIRLNALYGIWKTHTDVDFSAAFDRLLLFQRLTFHDGYLQKPFADYEPQAKTLLYDHVVSQAQRWQWFYVNARHFEIPNDPAYLQEVRTALAKTPDEVVMIGREVDTDLDKHTPWLARKTGNFAGNLDGAADDMSTQPDLFPPSLVEKNYKQAYQNALRGPNRGARGSQHGLQQVGQGQYDPGVYYGGHRAQTPAGMAPYPMQQYSIAYAQPGYGNAYPYGGVEDGNAYPYGGMDDGNAYPYGGEAYGVQYGRMDDVNVQPRQYVNILPTPESEYEAHEKAAARRKRRMEVAKKEVARMKLAKTPGAAHQDPAIPEKPAAQKNSQDPQMGRACWGSDAPRNRARPPSAVKESPHNPQFKSNKSNAGSKRTFVHGWGSEKQGSQGGAGRNGGKQDEGWATDINPQGDNGAQDGPDWPDQGGADQAGEARWSADNGVANNGDAWQQKEQKASPAWNDQPVGNDAGGEWGVQAGDHGANDAWGGPVVGADNRGAQQDDNGANVAWGGAGNGDDGWKQGAANKDDKKSNHNSTTGWERPQQKDNAQAGEWANNQGGDGWATPGAVDITGPSWGNGSVRTQKSTSKASRHSTGVSAPVSNAKSPYSNNANSKSIIKPYWQDWKKPFNRIEGLEARSRLHAEPRPVLQYPEQPLPAVPSGKTKAATHGIQSGKGSDYAHLCRRPVYLDSMEAPYAVFSFKYRSKEVLEKILKIRIDDSAVEEVKKRAERDELLNLPKHQLVEKLLASRT